MAALHSKIWKGRTSVLDVRGQDALFKSVQAAPHGLVAGFPCQPFSAGGLQQGASDNRFGTLIAILEVVALAKPTWLVLECVEQFATMNKGEYLRSLQGKLQQLGYASKRCILDPASVLPVQGRRMYLRCILTSILTYPGKQALWEQNRGTGVLQTWESVSSLKAHGWSTIKCKALDPGHQQDLKLTEAEVQLFLQFPGRRINAHMRLPRPLHRSVSLCGPCPCGRCGHYGLHEAHFQKKGDFAVYCVYRNERFFPPARITWSAMGFPASRFPQHEQPRLILAGLGNAVQPPLALAAPLNIQQVFIPSESPDDIRQCLQRCVLRSRGPG